MDKANNSQKPNGQEPVCEKTSGQQCGSERSRGKIRFSTVEMYVFVSLLVIVLVLEISILFVTISQINAFRAEKRADIQSLRADIRAGFTSADKRVVSSDERIDNLCERENELNRIRDKELDEKLDSLKKRVSRLEEAQECEG